MHRGSMGSSIWRKIILHLHRGALSFRALARIKTARTKDSAIHDDYLSGKHLCKGLSDNTLSHGFPWSWSPSCHHSMISKCLPQNGSE